MANTEIFLRNIFGTTRPNIRPLVLALNITNDLLFEQHISMSDIKATKHIYPDVARLLHKKPETVYKSVIRLAHRCWDALVEQDFISVICNGKKYIVYHIDSVNLLPMSDGNIIQGYLETTASGLLHMANMDKEALIHTLNRRKRAGEAGITTITPQFLKFLNGIRTNGYCFYSPNDPTICSHAFAVNNGNKVVAALGIVYSSEKDSDSYHSKIYRLGHIAASELSRRLSQSQA